MCWGPRFGCEDASTEFHGSFTKYRCREGKYIPNLLVRILFDACNLKKAEVAIIWSTGKRGVLPSGPARHLSAVNDAWRFTLVIRVHQAQWEIQWELPSYI